MLIELAVSDLGVISDLSLVLGPGMTALTGETGAGKTLVVEAIELLVGGRADPVLVRPGAAEARVEGRFVVDGDEVVLARVVPRDGRSRAYVNGRLATVATLAEWGRGRLTSTGSTPTSRCCRRPRSGPRSTDSARSTWGRGRRRAQSWLASTARSQLSAATIGPALARSTSCASKWPSSTPPGSRTPTRTIG